MIKSGTPWESYTLGGRAVWVKREDLCCPPPGPSFSKLRGVERTIISALNGILPPTRVGVVDSVHSKAGWGVAYICRELGIGCDVYYPHLKAEPDGYVRPFQQRARDMGAILHPLPATMSSVLYNQARSHFSSDIPSGLFLPNGLKLSETIAQTANELCLGVPKSSLNVGSVWVVSVSSGTIAAGVALGLERMGFKGLLVLHMGFSRSAEKLSAYVRHGAQGIRLDVVDEGYEYADAAKGSAPFPCNPYYDLKAWMWLKENIWLWSSSRLVVFWNIGA